MCKVLKLCVLISSLASLARVGRRWAQTSLFHCCRSTFCPPFLRAPQAVSACFGMFGIVRPTLISIGSIPVSGFRSTLGRLIRFLRILHACVGVVDWCAVFTLSVLGAWLCLSFCLMTQEGIKSLKTRVLYKYAKADPDK